MTAPDPDRAAAARDFYSRWAPGYDYLARHAPGVRRLRADLVDTLHLDPGDTAVDVGCGTGATLPYLRDRVGPEGSVLGVDFAPGAVARARDRTEQWANVTVCRGDATRLPLDDADAVVATFLVGMLPDPAATVRGWLADLDPERIALLDLARSHRRSGRACNPLFRLAVRASAPPGTATHHGGSPTRVLDRRVAAAHRAVLEACTDTTHETRIAGFAYLSAGSQP